MPVDYHHHQPERDQRLPPLPFLGRTRGGTGRTLADHLAGSSRDHSPAPRPGAAFLGRVRGGSHRTLADHLNPPAPLAAPAPPAPPAPAPPAPAPPAPAPPAPAPPAPPPAAPPPPVPGTARESERRTMLDADDPVITLGLDDIPRAGRLRIALSWTAALTAGGLRRSTDVHLGCLWQTTRGDSGVLQSLDGLLSAPGFGSRQVMRLGPRSEEEGESITLDLATLATMRRLLLFGYGQHGAPSWDTLGVRLTLALPSGAQVLLWPGPFPASEPASTVALASVHLVGDDVILRREDEPFAGPAQDVARAYGWDLPWNAAGSAPRR